MNCLVMVFRIPFGVRRVKINLHRHDVGLWTYRGTIHLGRADEEQLPGPEGHACQSFWHGGAAGFSHLRDFPGLVRGLYRPNIGHVFISRNIPIKL